MVIAPLWRMRRRRTGEYLMSHLSDSLIMFTICPINGRVVHFDSTRITWAIGRAGAATGEFGQEEAKRLTRKVLDLAHAVGLGTDRQFLLQPSGRGSPRPGRFQL